MGSLGRWAPTTWALVLALLLLGPALGHGYVLSYDMVWVPDLTLRPDFLGVGSGLPRAVPSDAVVSVLDAIIPGMLLQKLILLGSLVGGGVGAALLTDASSVTARLVATTVYEWSAFVGERLLMGHWPVLLGFAALPWVILACQSWRRSGTTPVALWFLLPLGSLSATSGLVTMVVVLAFLGARAWPRAVGMLLAANAPWFVSGLLHSGSALSDPVGARVFALHHEGSLPAPLAALGLGGIWNAEAVPDSRSGLLGWLSLVLVVVLVCLGARRWSQHEDRHDLVAYAVCWLVGWGGAVLGWAVPAVVGWAAGHVPGGGLLRDGSRLLALCAPALAAGCGYGAARVIEALPEPARPASAMALVLLPVALLPDLAFGLSGRIEPATYPADYPAARVAVDRARAAGAGGDVLLLPLSSYRQPAWNHGHKVLNPVGRYLSPDFVAGDDLFVSGRRVAGEDPRVRAAERALAGSTAAARSAALTDLGIGFVVTDRGAGPAPEVSGRKLLGGANLEVRQLAGPTESAHRRSWVWAMVAAWAAFLGLALVGIAVALVRAWRRPRDRNHDGACE